MPQIIQSITGAKLLVDTRVEISDLTEYEKYVWSTSKIAIKCLGGLPENVKSIAISDTIKYYDNDTFVEGCFRFETGEILIARSCLISPELFLGVLLHEIAHAKSNAYDVSKEFEDELTNFLGYVSAVLVKAVNNNSALVKPAKSLDFIGIGYAKCRCVDCLSSDFNAADDLSVVTCKNCGREYKGGYQELVLLNRQYIEQHGADIFLQDILGTLTNDKE
jgi:hypothetical protein